MEHRADRSERKTLDVADWLEADAIDRWFGIAVARLASLRYVDGPEWAQGLPGDGLVCEVARFEDDVRNLESSLGSDLSPVAAVAVGAGRIASVIVLRDGKNLYVMLSASEKTLERRFRDTVTIINKGGG